MHDYQPRRWVLLHTVVPLVAVVDEDPCASFPLPITGWDPLTSGDIASLGWRLLTATEAASAPTQELLAELDAAELEQIDYWRPATLGEVAFNCWD